MLPGPDQIIACPLCKGLAKYGTLESGNTFGERLWTDGKRHAPMLPQPPAVVKCRRCNGMYWLSKARKIGKVEHGKEKPPRVPREWHSAEYVQEPDELGYYQAIQAGLASNANQERDLRILAWWRSNDAYRNVEVLVAPTEHRRLSGRDDNLHALLTLLDESDENELVMKAEAYRELRMWGEGEALLRRVRSAHLTTVATYIRTLCESGESIVKEIELPRPARPPRPPKPVVRESTFLELAESMSCPHCRTRAVRYRQLSDGWLVCLACGRSLPGPEPSEGRA